MYQKEIERFEAETIINMDLEEHFDYLEDFDDFDECPHTDRFIHNGELKCEQCPAVFDENILEWI